MFLLKAVFITVFNIFRKSRQDHLVKKGTILELAKNNGCVYLVETGTYLGDMVEATKNAFEKVFSIELDKGLFHAAKLRFFHDKNVYLLQGDSGVVLQKVMPQLDKKAIFWLDGHFSGGFTAHSDIHTPIEAEITTILKQKNSGHIIVIDDARLFVGRDGYPTTDKLRAFVASAGLHLTVKDDLIIIK